jgi:hypothetical protein
LYTYLKIERIKKLWLRSGYVFGDAMSDLVTIRSIIVYFVSFQYNDKLLKYIHYLVGVTGLEPATPSPPD